MKLLERDNIKLEEVSDYHIYPIADNDTPRLSSDRLEYSLSNALFSYRLLTIDEIKEIYNDIEIQINEDGIEELGFKTKKLARKFVSVTSKLSIIYREDRTRYSMQYIADTIKHLEEDGLITIKDLYELKEQDIINIIEKSKYKEEFNYWRESTKVIGSSNKPDNLYYVKVPSKVRYIDPLFNNKRISKECKIANNMINKNLSYKMDNYVYLKDK